VTYAAVVYDKSKPLKIETVRHRALGPGEALVRLAACGVCHSDLSILNELYPCPTPVILGHEAAGVVEAIGPDVTAVRPGDHVVALWRPSCGRCRYCRSGRPHLCKRGEDPTAEAADRVYVGEAPVHEFLGIGGFAERTILREDALVKIDPAMPLDKAALLGCAVITGFGAARNAAHVKPGDEVAVFGCGGVGLNIIQGARRQGASVIVAVDLDDAKLALARRFGATHVFDGRLEDLPKAIRKATTEGQGVDFAFDAVGDVNLINQAWRSLCKGGEVILVGIPHMKATASISPIQSILSERGLRGSVAGSAGSAAFIGELVRLYQEGELNLDDLLTRRYSLREVNTALDDLRQGRNARGVLILDQPD